MTGFFLIRLDSLHTAPLSVMFGWLRTLEKIEYGPCCSLTRRNRNLQTLPGNIVSLEHRTALRRVIGKSLGPSAQTTRTNHLVDIFGHDGIVGDQVRQCAGPDLDATGKQLDQPIRLIGGNDRHGGKAEFEDDGT